MSAVDLSTIRTDGGTQPRAAIDTQLVETYAEDMASGAVFPPLVIFHDGVTNWLADGFHRFYAAKGCGLAEFECDVRQGTVRDAILFSVSANASHGLRRTNEDKRRAVLRLLNDPEWSIWSDREVARHARVSHEFVRGLRPPPSVNDDRCEPAERTVQRGGTTYTMNTAPIGRRPTADAPVFDATPASAGLQRPAPQAIEPPQAAPDNTTFHADRFIHARVLAVAEAVCQLPAPADAARRYPNILRASFSADQARDIADWFTAFADAWEAENGARNVAA